MEINGSDIFKDDVIEIDDGSNFIKGLIEKPKQEAALSNLVSIGHYILTPDIFDFLKSQSPGADGEIQLSYAINHMAIKSNVEAVMLNIMRFDCGSIKGYIM